MKRFISLAFCLILMASLFSFPAKAATYASDYLRDYDAFLSTGSRSGQLSLSFAASAYDSMTSIGVSSISVYTAEGAYVKTISGSTSNGLLASRCYSHDGTYSISVSPGQEYYLRLTFVARDSYSGDSKSYTTNTAIAAR
ncbi:hypothetical protein AALC17_17275 [Oscillospiraceae bacterium 38-13]